jgi:hypothetical protein
MGACTEGKEEEVEEGSSTSRTGCREVAEAHVGCNLIRNVCLLHVPLIRFIILFLAADFFLYPKGFLMCHE